MKSASRVVGRKSGHRDGRRTASSAPVRNKTVRRPDHCAGRPRPAVRQVYTPPNRRVPMEINRRALIARLGGVAAISLMDSESRADALEDFMSEQLDAAVDAEQQGTSAHSPADTAAADNFPTVAELEAQIETRNYRRGAGSLFVPQGSGLGGLGMGPADTAATPAKMKKLEPMPDKPTLLDFYKRRFAPANHVLQSAT